MLKFRLGKNLVLAFSFVAAAVLFSCNSEVSESVNISGIEVSAVPKKINYKNGEKLKLSGLEVKKNMTDGSSKILLPEEFSVEPAEGSVLKESGSVPVKIVSEGKTAFFPVYVEKAETVEIEKTFSVGLEISGLPEKKDYKIGESLNLAGLAVKMNKSDGTSVVLKESEYTVEPAAGTLLEEEGSVPVKISSEGKTAFFTVYVGKLSLKRLRIVSFPEKTYYLSDEVFKIDGLSVMCDFDNGTSKELSYGEYYISVLNGESLKDGFGQKITVSYGNVSAFFIINVSPSWDSAVIVDDGSHKIPLSKFNEAKNLRTVTIPDTIEEIGAQAFYKCVSLEEITLPASLKKIDRRAFYGCSSLKKIVIPDACRVGEEAFADCISVTELIFEGLWSAEKKCFANLVKLESLDLSGFSSNWMNVEEAFQGCASLSEITIPEGVYDIGGRMFENCTGLTKITIPDSVNYFGDMFKGCTGLTSIEIPNSVTEIGGSAFSGCTGLTSIEIPNSVTEIGGSAFSGCTGLTSIEIPNSVSQIGGSAFSGCTGLTSIEIPNSVSQICESVFSGCTGLTSIEIPDTVTQIGGSAFEGCTGLTSIEIPNSVTQIGDGAFSGCTGLTSIEIPNSVTEIGGSAFSGCTGLTSIEIPNSVTQICESVFSGCTGLTSIEIPDTVTQIGESAFEGCTGLTSIEIPDTVTTIYDGAFDNCISLSAISYQGTMAEFKAIDVIRNCWSLIGKTIKCSDGDFIYSYD